MIQGFRRSKPQSGTWSGATPFPRFNQAEIACRQDEKRKAISSRPLALHVVVKRRTLFLRQ